MVELGSEEALLSHAAFLSLAHVLGWGGGGRPRSLLFLGSVMAIGGNLNDELTFSSGAELGAEGICDAR